MTVFFTDFWILSSPRVRLPPDQLGNGFMQYYGQDVAASVASDDAVPYDFSVDPDVDKTDGSRIPPASDFFWYVSGVSLIKCVVLMFSTQQVLQNGQCRHDCILRGSFLRGHASLF